MPVDDSDEIRLDHLTWPELDRLGRLGWDTVLLPLGSTEQHGPHLPLGTDAVIATEVALRAARRLGRTLVAPVLPIGCSDEHRDFPGMLSVDHETLTALILDVCRRLLERDLRPVVFSAHGGNGRALQRAAGIMGPRGLVIRPELEFSPAAFLATLGVGVTRSGVHAGLAETSMMLASDPSLVREERYQTGYVGDLEAIWKVLTTRGLRAATPNGVLGDPSGSTAERGEACLDAWADSVAWLIRRWRESGA
ncbi:MAG: mycofactocin biosynthesis peptidyl-dipeptidase MftE [Candidatus Dormibacteraeota bacterium]|nr:mycofactocin biosynthesis peptidyl-dipeptidase MftE [Candidatus Dormibacteraeota bacterium]MBO0704628.1 mycofactocin biosynthesis peptidyl-dipeptidase MftE [Candidatus Dormibacteraeota bacterium]MBO0760509.1 mycofactocin biosynthesis peptidyl-dipeptidase MftE [Candidatus Dormibacteraeota bacterium]